MEGKFELFPTAASTTARDVDAVFFLVLGVTAFFTTLIAVLLMYFAVKYRRRSENEVPQPAEGSLRLELFWTVVPLLIGLFIFYEAASAYFRMITPPPDALEVNVVGRQWMWHLQHAGGQREINTLHVPVGRPVKLTMTSADVIHSFAVPAFRVRQDVLPGRYTTLWFEATRTGTFHLFCAEYCGTNHSAMIGKVVVMEPRDFQRWLSANADGSPADAGRKLFQRLHCVTCHSGDARGKAPLLEAIYGKEVPLEGGGTATVDDDYLRESILDPRRKVHAGFKTIMPPYAGQVTEEEMADLLAFLRALGPGQTPPRVERSEPKTDTP